MGQETLEEAARNTTKIYVNEREKQTAFLEFINGAKWQAEKIPSIIEEYLETAFISKEQGYMNPKDWFEKFKNK
jgi:hypothetical protein